jgi:uncharacterized protein involved in type VI secretion and phage assembly
MSGVLPIIRRVVTNELAARRDTALGYVTSTFPHEEENDGNNYDVNVALKYENLELRRVPVAAPHIGGTTPPRVGDLVLVTFVGGQLNQPVVTGRFYDEQNRPPIHKDDEVLFEQRLPDGTINQLRMASDGSVFLQRDVTKPEDNSEAKASIRLDGGSGDIEIKAGNSVVITLKNDAEIEIKSDKTTIKGNVEIQGDLVVKSGANSTTISGNSIAGSGT